MAFFYIPTNKPKVGFTDYVMNPDGTIGLNMAIIHHNPSPSLVHIVPNNIYKPVQYVNVHTYPPNPVPPPGTTYVGISPCGRQLFQIKSGFGVPPSVQFFGYSNSGTKLYIRR